MKYGPVLRQRNFVLMTVGTGMSTLGDQMGWIALLWLVMSMTHSPERMGLAGLCYGLPTVLVGPFAGVLLDRLPRLHLMRLDNVVQGFLFLLIPIMYWVHSLQFWVLCAVLVCAGVASPLTAVGAMTLVPDFVPEGALSEANALEEALWQGANLTGPLLGGSIISLFGAPMAIVLDGMSFWGCALCLLFVRQASDTHHGINRNEGWRVISNTIAGLKALASLPVVLVITLIALLLNLAYGQLDVALPLLVHQELHRGGALLGALWTAYGIGALMGTAIIGFIPTDGRRGFWMSAMVAGMGGSLTLMTWAHGLWFPALLMGLAGLCFGPYAPLARTIVQTSVPEELRGRVFGIRASIIGMGVPTGSLLAGAMLQILRPSLWVGVTGAGVLTLGAMMLLSRRVRMLE